MDISPHKAIALLEEGNRRFVADAPQNPHRDEQRRRLTSSKGQSPLATVLACSDSRVPVEILFDRGIGDIFVIRVAGNVAGADAVGSIEYAVAHLKTPAVVILGHSDCGAVTAVVKNAELDGQVLSIVKRIHPAVAEVKKNHPGLNGDTLINAAIKQNVWRSIQGLLEASPITREKIRAEALQVVGAIYDIQTGGVHWQGVHPRQDEWLKAGGTGSKDGKGQ